MKISELVKNLNAQTVFVADNDKEVQGGYCGDFLSVVMGKAPEGSVWFTIMNNQNVAAVATLTEVGVVVLCEGTEPDVLLAKKAEAVGINIIKTEYPVFEAVLKSGL